MVIIYLNIYIFIFIYFEGLASSSIYNTALLLNKSTNCPYNGVLLLFILFLPTYGTQDDYGVHQHCAELIVQFASPSPSQSLTL